MKRTAKAASKKGFTLIELVVVVAIIGVLAGLLVPTMFDAVTNSRIASAQQTAKVIRDRSAEFFTKMDTQMHTHVGEVQKVVITVDNGTWSMTGGAFVTSFSVNTILPLSIARISPCFILWPSYSLSRTAKVI